MADNPDDDCHVDCSDDDTYGLDKSRNGREWLPTPNRVAEIYEQLEKTGCLELEWKCPGRRPPSTDSPSSASERKTSVTESTKQSITTEFDFDEEFADSTTSHGTVPLVPRRKTGQTSKKVTKLDKVMSDMKKYQTIDQQTNQPD